MTITAMLLGISLLAATPARAQEPSLVEGFSDQQFESRTGLPVSVLERALAPIQERGLVARGTDTWRTTPQGFRFLNDILVALLD